MAATLGFQTPRDDNDVAAAFVAPSSKSNASTTKSITVTSASTTLIPSNSLRLGAAIVNNGSVDMYVCFNATAVSGATSAAGGGIVLKGGGGSMSIDQSLHYTGPFSAITGSSSTVAGIVELIA